MHDGESWSYKLSNKLGRKIQSEKSWKVAVIDGMRLKLARDQEVIE